MKRIFIAGMTMLALCGGAALAQEGRPGFGVGVAATGQLPVGDYADVAGFGIGGLAGIEMGMNPGLALTARVGYIQHLEKEEDDENFKVRHIPILGGVKFMIPETPVYLAGEVGAVMSRAEVDIPILGTDTESETNLGWGVGLGTAAGPLDLRLSWHTWDAGNMAESMTIGLSLGFTVWSL